MAKGKRIFVENHIFFNTNYLNDVRSVIKKISMKKSVEVYAVCFLKRNGFCVIIFVVDYAFNILSNGLENK